ncbi:MAG: Asp-tRNA(Asn)/Glu-tRNA(Gln) amidotransferase subunit GatA, partial [bacterium]|nr:Asp-tRNA(Asn)/Glu-tRNA(Gln) amidotransferase subunit GatA [bacterium]
IHAFLSVFEDEARHMADQSDERRTAGASRGPLEGIPIAIKDNMLVEGRPCTSASRMLEDYVAVEDASVIQKLKSAGAILIGKTNLDEFAMGGSTEFSAFGATSNPHDRSRVAGGSSGGSAAAVSAGMVPCALGSDTGGSIRQPASFCGIVGLKPTYGRVSRYGLLAMASSLDQIGPMTRNVDDSALLFSVISGQDPKDQTTEKVEPFTSISERGIDGLRIGLPVQSWGEGIDPAIREAVMGNVKELEARGAKIQEIDMPATDSALAVYYVLMPCEVSANMSRYDGMRYGLHVESNDLMARYLESRRQGLGDEVRRRILLGTFALSHGYFDAYYLKAKKVQAKIRKSMEEAFRDVDVLITPTTPSTAFAKGEKMHDPLAMYLQDIFTVGANVAGVPAISVPCGSHNGMPIGLQITGSWFEEAELLAVAKMCET